jgi:hypothetical protein
LLPYIGLPTRLIIQDPDYLYCGVTTTVEFNSTATNLLPDDISSRVLASIQAYSAANLQTFNGDLRFSKFVAAIDATDPSIISNETNLTIIRRISPFIGFPTSYNLNYYNPSEQAMPAPGTISGQAYDDNPVLISSPFTYTDAKNVNWPNSFIRDDSEGNLVVYTIINNAFTVLNSNLGTISYANGTIAINNLIASNYGNYISLYMTPANPDILVNLSAISIIDPNDVKINVLSV